MCGSAHHIFLGNTNIIFWPKRSRIILKTSVTVTQHHRASNPQPLYHPTDGGTTALPVCCLLDDFFRNFVIYKDDWLSIKFCENNSLRKLFLFFWKYLSVSWWNLPGYFCVSFWFPQVTEFGKSTTIYLADSFCQLYSALWSAWQEDPNDPQDRCAMAQTSCARLQEN